MAGTFELRRLSADDEDDEDARAILRFVEFDEELEWRLRGLSRNVHGVALMLETLDDMADSHGTGAWFLDDGRGESVALVLLTPGWNEGELSLAYGVAPEHRGMGMAGRAAGMALSELAGAHPGAVVATRVESDNPASAAVLAALGFEPAGSLVAEDHDGALVDVWSRDVWPHCPRLDRAAGVEAGQVGRSRP